MFSLHWTPNSAVLISSARSFMNIENSVGERMQPCFTPFWISNQSVRSLLTLTALSTLSYNDLIRFRNGPFIPNLFNFVPECHSVNRVKCFAKVNKAGESVLP